MEDQTNPWARANVFQYDKDTLALVHPDQRQKYLEVIGELAVASQVLNEAQARYYQAVEARVDFFKGTPGE